MPSQNKLDRKPIRNSMAGKHANVHIVNPVSTPSKKNLAGFGKGSAPRAKNPLSTPTNRLGLTFRSVADGVNLIESIKEGVLTEAESLSQNHDHGFFGTIRGSTIISRHVDQLFTAAANGIASSLYKRMKVSVSAQEVSQFLDSGFGRHLANEVSSCQNLKEMLSAFDHGIERIHKDIRRWKKQVKQEESEA